ncbi:MAG: glycoside hydrolase family 5 protein, partial [Rhodoferax sp.]
VSGHSGRARVPATLRTLFLCLALWLADPLAGQAAEPPSGVAGKAAPAAQPSVTVPAAAVAGAARGTPLPRVVVEAGQWRSDDGRPIYLKGANLGNWLMLEFWMMGYPDNAAVNDQCTFLQVLDRRFGVAQRERLLKLFRENWISARDWDWLPRFGLNLVRLPFIWSVLEDENRPYHLRADAWHYLDAAIDQAEARGMYVILDLHGAVGSQGLEHHSGCAGKNEFWTSAQYRQRTAWLWQQIAARYRDRTAVAGYSLLNEPWGAPETQMADEMAKLYRAVREVDPQHVIILPGHASGIDAYGDPAQQGMHNVAFEMHFYPGFFGWGKPDRQVHQEWLGCLPKGGLCDWKARMARLGAPLFVGEFQPWADLDQETGGQVTRISFDAYAKPGWASAVWAYKRVTGSGGQGIGNWGLVTNHADAPLALLDFTSASLEDIEKLFLSYGSMRYEAHQGVLKWMHSAAPPDW